MTTLKHFGAALFFCLLQIPALMAQSSDPTTGSDEKAVVHIYRAFGLDAGRHHIKVNGEKVARLKNNEVHTFEAPAGTIDIRAKTWGQIAGKLTILLEKGGTYYLRVHERPALDWFTSRLEVIEVTERTFRRETGLLTKQ